MIRVTLKGLAGRRLRAALTALAIVLGVAMVSGTLAFTDRIENAVDTLFTGAYSGADAVISGKDVVESSTTGDATVPAELLRSIAAVPEVDAVAGGIVDTARLLDRAGRPISTQDQALGLSVDARPDARRFNPLALTAGRWPTGSGETAIDAATAQQHGFEVGDTIGVATRGPVRRFTISGLARFTGLDSLGELTLAIFDVPTAQAVFDKPGRLDEVWVAANDDVSSDELVGRLGPLVTADGEIATGRAQVRAESKGSDEELARLRKFLLAFGGIALFVGAFVIFNTLSITIAQRTRELATLRTLGASRRQVLTSVAVESAVIGVLGSLVGLLLGLGLDRGLAALVAAADDSIPDSGAVLTTRTVAVSVAVGVVITLAAGLMPALRATRVPPIAAVREGATLPSSPLERYTRQIAAAAIALGAGVISVGLFAGGLNPTQILALLALGCLVTFLGVGAISPALVKPLAALVGLPAQHLAGAAGRLARENSVRNPSRTALTAAALMVFMALVTFVAVLGQGMRNSVTDGVDRVVRADYVVTSDDGASTLPADVGRTITGRAGAASASSVRQDSARAFAADTSVNGLDGATIAELVRLDWDPGAETSLANLGADGAIVQHDFAAAHDLRVGSRFDIKTAHGKRVDLTVRGVYTPPGLAPILAPVGISRETFDASFERPRDAFTLIRTGGDDPNTTERALQARLKAFPEAQLQTTAQFRDSRAKDIRTTLIMVYVLLGMTVLVSLLGMINTLVLSVMERTRELGLLRAVGMTRLQVRRMIRHESVITALIGAALGLPLGLLLAALVTQALSDIGVAFAVPGPALALLVLTAILAGLLAAIYPARRASRLNVLEALHYE
jgi:putative ABC transport system permease protein